MSAGSVRVRRSPSQHCTHERVYARTTWSAMYDMRYPPPPPPPPQERSIVSARSVLRQVLPSSTRAESRYLPALNRRSQWLVLFVKYDPRHRCLVQSCRLLYLACVSATENPRHITHNNITHHTQTYLWIGCLRHSRRER